MGELFSLKSLRDLVVRKPSCAGRSPQSVLVCKEPGPPRVLPAGHGPGSPILPPARRGTLQRGACSVGRLPLRGGASHLLEIEISRTTSSSFRRAMMRTQFRSIGPLGGGGHELTDVHCRHKIAFNFALSPPELPSHNTEERHPHTCLRSLATFFSSAKRRCEPGLCASRHSALLRCSAGSRR